MRTPFNIDNWSRLAAEDSDHQNYLMQQRNILFSRFSLVGSLAAVSQGIFDSIVGYPFLALLDLVLAVLLVAGYIMNERRYHRPAKLIIFFGFMFLLFGYASVVPKGVGMYLLYFPLVAFSFIVLDYEDRKTSYSLALLALILNVILVITKYQPFGDINLQPIDPTGSFALNLVISIVLMVVGIDFLIKTNLQAEKNLLAKHEETEKLAHEINHKNLTLQKTNEELDRFVYSTSHDLRSPLASIMGLINLTELSDQPISQEVRNYLELMKDRVNNLDSFIQDIIDYSRNTRMDLVFGDVDLNELIDQVVLNSQFLDNAQYVNLETHIAIKHPIKVDATRLARILNNLVSNSIKYNDLQKENPSVTIKAELLDNKLLLEVADTGKGIRPEIQDKIFDMFYRGTETSDGSGLGLYITREMVQKMDGKISFNSKYGKGTTFNVEIPLKKT